MVRKSFITILLSLSLLFAACGGSLLASLRAASASANPFIDTLVSQGVISSAKAITAKADVDDIIDAIGDCDMELKAIVSTGPARKIAKARAYKNLATRVRAVLARHNIGGSPQLDRISAIFDGAALALEIYFASVTGTGGPESSVASDPDKALEDALKKAERELKGVTKH